MNKINPLPLIVFCTTCKGRTPHIEQTLAQNILDNEDYPNCKFVLVDYGDPGTLEAYIKENHLLDIEQGKLVVYKYDRHRSFRMAHAKNMAHRLGIIEGAEVLVNLDADNYTTKSFAKYIAAKFEELGEKALLWAKWNQPGMDPGSRIPKGCCGRVVASTNSFLKAGGYDEKKFNTWGPDDKDFHFRLRRLGCISSMISPKYLSAVLHNDKLRFKEYPMQTNQQIDYSLQSFDDFGETIANYGKVGLGLVYKNYNRNEPVDIKSIPTRIFGIGMHKTATTSLHHALEILGFDSAHWKSVRWAKAIWEQMVESGEHRSRTLEQNYALSDLPITLIYEELDRTYPGSKFILTVRDEQKWLKSVEKHWSNANGFKDTWKKEDKFVHKIHSAVYGQTEFDPTVFLQRYKQHNAEVLEYFRNRPQDLLVMDMDNTKYVKCSGWDDLCTFLSKEIPSTPYPISFVTPASGSAID